MRLKIRDDEKGLVATNPVSIGQAYTEPRTFPLGIYRLSGEDAIPVGFIYYGQFAEDNGEWWIARLMIDENHRRKGYAMQAVKIVLDELRARKDCDKVYLSIIPSNTTARSLYEKLGFRSTGEVPRKEEIFCLSFD